MGFILMGLLAQHSDIGPDLYNTFSKWFGRLPGGLAIATTFGCASFAAITGASSVGILTFGPISYKPMVKYEYDKRLVGGIICSASTMGVLIPPSIAFIVYGMLTEESVGRLFIAGIIPGVIQALMYSVLIFIVAGLGIWKGPPGPRYSWREKLVSLGDIWGMLSLFILVIGGIYMGIFSPTEGGAVGAFGALVIFLLRKGFQWTVLKQALIETVRVACMSYTIVAGSMIFSQFIALTKVSIALSYWIGSLSIHPLFVISIILVGYIILGFPMPAVSMIVLTVPTLYPIIVNTLVMNGVWFGVLVAIMVEIANISPPVGVNLFVMQSLFPEEDMSVRDLYSGVMPFLGVDCIRVIILLLFPVLSLWLPNQMYGA